MASWPGKTALATCAGAAPTGHLQPLPKAAMALSFQFQHQQPHQHQHQHQHQHELRLLLQHELRLLLQHELRLQPQLPGLLPQLPQLWLPSR